MRASSAEFVDAGGEGVVIDLRSGVGGSLKAVLGVPSALCSAEHVLASSEQGGKPVVYVRTGERIWPDRPVAVLVNEQSTSAAEFLAVDLEELANAALVGAPRSGGLNTLRFTALPDGYLLVLLDKICLGPKTLVARPGYRLEPTIPVPNPTSANIRDGVDAQREAARAWVLGHGAG